MQAKLTLATRLLNTLEEELAGLNWPAKPSQEALASSLPFCVDTMGLKCWLAWVFLPKMRQLIAEACLPNACAVSEQVEMQLSLEEQQRLLPITQAIDSFISLGKVPPASLFKKPAEKF